jgi:hypothetical protein
LSARSPREIVDIARAEVAKAKDYGAIADEVVTGLDYLKAATRIPEDVLKVFGPLLPRMSPKLIRETVGKIRAASTGRLQDWSTRRGETLLFVCDEYALVWCGGERFDIRRR